MSRSDADLSMPRSYRRVRVVERFPSKGQRGRRAVQARQRRHSYFVEVLSAKS